MSKDELMKMMNLIKGSTCAIKIVVIKAKDVFKGINSYDIADKIHKIQ